MPYLLLDPTDPYAASEKRFLDRLGLECVVLLSSPQRAGLWQHKWRRVLSDNVIAEHVIDREKLDELADELTSAHPEGFFGIVAWDETHILLAADVNERLGLDWNTREVIERFRDKALMKAHLREVGGVRVNRSATVDDEVAALRFQESVDAWPVVVKPSGGAGSMSVYFADDENALRDAVQAVRERGLGDVLLEEFVGGEEFAVNGLADHAGDVLVTDVWRYDKRDIGGRRNLYWETLKIGTDEDPFLDVAAYAQKVVQALGLRRSPFHMEVKVDDRGPCLIEVGARFAGGNQVGMASRLHRHSLFELAACHYLDDIRISPRDVDYEHYDAMSARILSGVQDEEIERVARVVGLAEVEALPSFAGTGMLRRPGMRVPVSRDVNSKAWEVYLLHPDPEQVAADAEAARELLRYE